MELIKEYIVQGEKIKLKFPEIWHYDDVLDELKSFIENTNLPESRLKDYFYKTEISKFNDFPSFIKAKDITTINYKFPTILKQKKTKLRCLYCNNTEFIIKSGVYVCRKCRQEFITKSNNQLITKDSLDPSKHIMKQIKTITNEIKPPVNVQKIIPVVVEWFKNKQHLKDYLKFSNKLKYWYTKYQKITGVKINESFFDTPLEDVTVDYNLFKLYTDIFYDMTSDMVIYRKKESNMLPLTNEEILEICRAYYEKYKCIPVLDLNSPITFTYNNINYEIGAFIARQLILDLDHKTYLKQELSKIFNRKLNLPGLTFSFEELFIGVKTLKIPKKFNYQQHYSIIIHSIYNIPYETITNADKKIICDIMMDFNDYVKNIKSDSMGKKGNSILWHVNLSCVLKLPYFRCYKNIFKLLPNRVSNKTLPILELWTSYLVINYEKMSLYINTLRKFVEKQDTAAKFEKTDYDINNKELIDFITETGESFSTRTKDTYLYERLNIKYNENDWQSKMTFDDNININQEEKKSESEELNLENKDYSSEELNFNENNSDSEELDFNENNSESEELDFEDDSCDYDDYDY